MDSYTGDLIKYRNTSIQASDRDHVPLLFPIGLGIVNSVACIVDCYTGDLKKSSIGQVELYRPSGRLYSITIIQATMSPSFFSIGLGIVNSVACIVDCYTGDLKKSSIGQVKLYRPSGRLYSITIIQATMSPSFFSIGLGIVNSVACIVDCYTGDLKKSSIGQVELYRPSGRLYSITIRRPCPPPFFL